MRLYDIIYYKIRKAKVDNMKKVRGNRICSFLGCILLSLLLLLTFFSCGKEAVPDPHKDFVSAAVRLFMNCSDAGFDHLERYEWPEYGEIYYYLEAHSTRRGETITTSGIIDIAVGGSWEYYHSEGFEGVGKQRYQEYLARKKAGSGGEITGEELEILTQRINDELQKALADTAE